MGQKIADPTKNLKFGDYIILVVNEDISMGGKRTELGTKFNLSEKLRALNTDIKGENEIDFMDGSVFRIMPPSESNE